MGRRTRLCIGLFFGVTACGSSTSHPSSANPGSDATAGSDDGPEPGDAGPGSGQDAGQIDGEVSLNDSAAGMVDGPTQGIDGSDGGGKVTSGRAFPDTFASIALLVDQLPSMNMAQMQFATSHYVGTEKQLLPVTQALRALNPAFLVLHYHLAMWQSAPATQFIVDGTSWSNDYPTVTMNESWFWHNTESQRVTSNVDQKLLMNVSVQGFQQYWAQSLAQQVADGQYDGIMFDSASPALLQGECGGSGDGQDSRLAGTAARYTTFSELGGTTWIDAWQSWIAALSTALSAQGIPLIPNTSAFTTGWDNTDYTLSPGAFVEGFAGTDFAVSDWEASTNELLKLASLGRIMILQNYLSSPSDVATRMYYLGNYLLVKAHQTYLDYFDNDGPLEWYPEWAIDLGSPTTPSTTNVADLASAGVYRRDFQHGSVLVNPTASPVTVSLGGTFQQVVPSGGGLVDTSGTAPGTLTMQSVTSVTVGATTAVVVLN
jgi:hypothetical protein